MAKERRLPHNIEAEQSVLGAMILDKDAIVEVVDILKEDDYYKEAHRYVHRAIIHLFNENRSIDMVTVSEELNNMGFLDLVGGMDYLSEISNAGILTSHARTYALIVEEKSLKRKLIMASSEIVEKGYELEDAKALLELAEKSIFDISQKQTRDGLTDIKDVIMSAHDEIERVSKAGGKITGISTGFRDLDEKTNGLQRSDLVLIAARPSMGKTAFSLNLCQNAALRSNATVAIFSLEMAKEQLVTRMLAAESLISIQKIKTGDLTENDWSVLATAMSPLANAKIFIDDTPGITVMEMRAKCRRLAMEQGGIDMIMVDYLQLMSGGDRSENRQQEISTISRNLKALAREMNCPMVALSQLSRASELRADHRPILSDLRESGAIEQDADLVMFLYRDEYYHPESEKKGIGEIIIAKQRNGETGAIELAWLGQYQKFGNLERYRD